jgi:altronate hydrolase
VKAVLVISERDNVATALQALRPGQRIDVNGSIVIVAEAIARGHKIALRDIPPGEPVIKYGSAIGTASAHIAAGAHVHTHNVASGRGRGDLDAPMTAGARLAEPPDDGAVRNGSENGAAAPTTTTSESSS